VDRARALSLTERLLERLVDGQDEWPLRLVREVYVFGSYARGAPTPGDVDLDVEFDHKDEQWRKAFIAGLSYGYDARRVFRQALVGRTRGVQFMFDGRSDADFDMTLLWRRGDDLQTAVDRLRAIKVDMEAGRAERDAMLPEFEGLDRWLIRPYRECLADAIGAGAIRVERITLNEVDVAHPQALAHLDDRWQRTSPLYRAGSAVFADVIARNIDPAQVHLHGRDVKNPVTPIFAGFGLRYLHTLQRAFTKFGGEEWIEVVHPTRRGDLHALRILITSRDRLEKLDWL
jgi:hypothetical protein